MIPESTWMPGYTEQAKEHWKKYQQEHDLSTLRGQVAGIDPVTGRVWIGKDPIEVTNQLTAEGLSGPLYFVRVGYDYLYRKGKA